MNIQIEEGLLINNNFKKKNYLLVKALPVGYLHGLSWPATEV